MENKKLKDSSESILDKFDDLANKMNQGTKPTKDEKQAADDKPEDAKHKDSEKPEDTKAENTKDTAATTTKEADKENPATKDDTKEEPKDSKAEDKKEPAKKESNDNEDSKVELETEKKAEPDDKSEEVAKTSGDNPDTEWHTAHGVETIKDDKWDKLYEILNKSYENYQELSERINNTEALVKSINDNLVPTVQKAMDLIKDNDDLVDKDSTSPEEVAEKSAELEDKQQVAKDTISKSAGETKETIAKDSNSKVVDEVVNKDNGDKGVSTNNADEAQKDTNFTKNDYRFAALGVVGNFNKNLARDLKAGVITKNEASYRNSMTNAVYNNTASVSTLKKYIELAK